MSDDLELAALLGEAPKTPDPGFRYDVLARVAEHAQRRAAFVRGFKQAGALTLLGISVPLAQALGLGAHQLQPMLLALAAVGCAYILALTFIRGPSVLRAGSRLRVRV